MTRRQLFALVAAACVPQSKPTMRYVFKNGGSLSLLPTGERVLNSAKVKRLVLQQARYWATHRYDGSPSGGWTVVEDVHRATHGQA